jgi:asparagine synthase (glutamine-hydrolysing)
MRTGTVWLVCNGEIYNFQDLRTDLLNRGHQFRSRTDTETIIHLYEEYGEGCLEHLRGMFALAIWDGTRRKLLLARDRLGIKPLYYVRLTDGVLFASEIKALLASGFVAPELDVTALDHYVSFGYVPPPATLVRDIRSFCAAEMGVVHDSHFTLRRYWAFPEEGTTVCGDQEIVPQVRNLLEESIRLHRVSDAPLGAFLSGGVDSTAVVGLMARIQEDPIRTVSLGFEADGLRFDETPYATLAADHFHTVHTEVRISGRDLRDELDALTWYLDQPSFDGINTYFVSRAARQAGLTVAISGLGGDELFGGYESYDFIPRWSKPIRLWGRLPRQLRDWIGTGLGTISALGNSGGRMHKISRLPWVRSPMDLYALARMNLWRPECRAIYSDGLISALDGRGSSQEALELLRCRVGQDVRPWRMIHRLEMEVYLTWRLLRDTDAMSMAHSLEVRVPLLDHKLVEFVFGLPNGWERRFGYPKRLLTLGLSDLLPSDILNRPKHGFELPMANWMKNELRPVLEDVFSLPSLNQRGLFQADRLRQLYSDFLEDRVSYEAVWQMVVLELWLRQYFDRLPGSQSVYGEQRPVSQGHTL